jgi:hypothetical protein
MATPRRFAARTEASICAILAAALSFQDRVTGGFTRVDCGPS